MKRFILVATLFATPAFAQNSAEELSTAFCAALVAEDADALANLYTEDADLYGPDGLNYTGRDAIRANWAGFVAAFDNFSCSIEPDGRFGDKKSATSWGSWEITATPAGGGDPVAMSGRFMDYTVKTKNGWKYRADHASAGQPKG